eukprot:TRINITY_DN9620_c0_g1::TRINITY_DN9620_c0_g1_i1::g.10147::m.10147 TRINITY_DN9620_c0_g1::TRINITY_DN9620_c0_g1_i1::g.10147  ORF type:complete len:110 (+),score=8.53,MadL/PF03817.8/0.026 TRINITY_DN9620_c0_g1_i1:379-708(+)
MVLLGAVEGTSRGKLGVELSAESRRMLLHSLLCNVLLGLIVVKDGTLILTAALGSRCVLLEKVIDDLLVGNALGVEDNLHGLSMVTHLMVGRILGGASGVPNLSLYYTI